MAFFYFFLLVLFLIIISPLIAAFFFLYMVRLGFDFLDFSPSVAFLILFLILIGSFINIPLTKKRLVKVSEPYFLGMGSRPVWRAQGVSVNVGGALIPLLIAGYFFPQVPLQALLVTTTVVAFFSFLGARFIEKRGVVIPMILPVLFSAFFAVILAPSYAAQVAFSAGVLGVLIGADLFYLPFVLKKSGGVAVLGGAGVFDGIFLVGLISAFLAAL